MSGSNTGKHDTQVDIKSKRYHRATDLSQSQNGQAEGILIPMDCDRQQISEPLPARDATPHPTRSQRQIFKSQEEREDSLRQRKRESAKRSRARKKGENIPYMIAHRNAQGRFSRDPTYSEQPRSTTANANATDKTSSRRHARQVEPDIPEGYYDIGRPLPPGYRYAEPYTIDTRYRDIAEETERSENDRLQALDEVEMLQPLVNHLQGLDLSTHATPIKSSVVTTTPQRSSVTNISTTTPDRSPRSCTTPAIPTPARIVSKIRPPQEMLVRFDSAKSEAEDRSSTRAMILRSGRSLR